MIPAVTLKTAIHHLAGQRLSRKSRFVDVLYQGCASWRNFAATKVADSWVIAAYDEETRLWNTDPDVVARHFRTTILQEARELLRVGEKEKRESEKLKIPTEGDAKPSSNAKGKRAASATPSSSSHSKSKRTRLDPDSDTDSAISDHDVADPDPDMWLDWGDDATGLGLALTTLLAALKRIEQVVVLDVNDRLTNFADCVVEDCENGLLEIRNRVRSDCVSSRSCINVALAWEAPDTPERREADEKARAIVQTAILNDEVRTFRIRWVANGIFRYKTYEAVKMILYTVSGPDTMKTTLDMAEKSAFEPLISFVTLKGASGGLSERAIINARERIHKVAEARQTRALMESIKDQYCALNNATQTRGYTSDTLSKRAALEQASGNVKRNKTLMSSRSGIATCVYLRLLRALGP